MIVLRFSEMALLCRRLVGCGAAAALLMLPSTPMATTALARHAAAAERPASPVAEKLAAEKLAAEKLAAEKPAAEKSAAEKPAAAQPAPEQPGPEHPEHIQVDGFRSAHWGMTEAQVKAAIQKDFNISPDKVSVEENASERTKVMTVTVADLLDGAGRARVSYILGYSTKKLIQVNVVWGTTVDPHAKPEGVVAAANQLRTLFLTSGYAPETIASNVATGEGTVTVFQGQDAEKHMTLLRIFSAAAPAPRQRGKAESAGPTVVLQLSYVQDASNPDVYRLKKGQF